MEGAAAAEKRGIEWLRFEHLVAGHGRSMERSWRYMSTEWMSFLCKPSSWRAMRAHAYETARLPLRSTAALPKQRIVFLGGNPKSGTPERRQVVNEKALVDALRTRFPGVAVDAIEMRDLKTREQLVELSSTSVLVSTLGSKSFRMVLLPDGAQVILLSPVFNNTNTNNFAELYRTEGAWGEVDNCWGQMGYINVLVYKPPSANDITPNDESVSKGHGVEKYTFRSERNADVFVREQEFGDLVAVALRNARLPYVQIAPA